MSPHVKSLSLPGSVKRGGRFGVGFVIVALLGSAEVALGDAGHRQGTKLAPVGHELKAKNASGPTRTADGPEIPKARTTPGAHSGRAPLAPPANDDCSGAIVIPAGPFPVVTTPIDITQATPQGVDDPDVCPDDGVEQTIWFSFTPSVTGRYIFSTCAGSGATGTSVYDTVIGLFDSTGGACPSAAGLVCNDLDPACASDIPGAPYVDQSTVSAVLTAGNVYFVAAGHWLLDGGGVIPGLNRIAILVDRVLAPENDTCATPTPLSLDRITFGTTVAATNDYSSPPNCFTGVGQIASAGSGLDVVFSFVPPTSGSYSFRYVQDDTSDALRSQSPVLYLADTCPAPNPATPVAGCIKGANRMNDQTTGNGNRSEEIDCVTLSQGTPYYLFFDDDFTENLGGPLAVQVTRCVTETEPNDDPATATPYSACAITGTSSSGGPAGDIDFYDLGAPAAGSKIFVAIDAAASNSSDYEMRITNATDTLGYDDNDGTSWIGSNAPVIAGVFADGSELYARINSKLVPNEPYKVYARIETGPAQNEAIPDPPSGGAPSNGTFYAATHLTGGGFVKGTIYGWDVVHGPTDVDCFRFVMNEGDNLFAFSDNNPARVPGVITNVWPVLQTIDGDPPSDFRFSGQVVRNNLTPSPATLSGVTPSVTSNFMNFRARYTGAYAICYEPTGDTGNAENPPPAAYPLPYQGSISINCAPIPAPGSTDVSVTVVGPSNPAKTGSLLDYVITLTNTGSEIAQDVRLVDFLPPELVYVGLSVVDGFNGNNTGCISLPSPGANDAPLDCTNYAIAPGTSVIYTLSVQVSNCIGAGLSVVNTASITTFTTDGNSANDESGSSVTTSEDGSCNDLVCDVNGCIADGCTINDHCDASGACVSDLLSCDDNNLCTADSCDSATGCVNDASQLGDLCFDGNDCTIDACDPVDFCVFPSLPAGTACNDFLTCTGNDLCDGQGGCVGQSVCDDGLPCTDDFADEANACACDNPLSFPGTFCDDGNACTAQTVCDGTGGTVASCTGGSVVSCDDSIPCTDDSCVPATGCVHTTACTPADSCHTAGTCNPLTGTCSGSTLKPVGSSCQDGDACTTGDACNSGGVCLSGSVVVCDDLQSCTADSCDPDSGCVNASADLDPSGFSANRIDGRDLVKFAYSYASCFGGDKYIDAADLDKAADSACSNNGLGVGLEDFHLFMTTFGQGCP